VIVLKKWGKTGNRIGLTNREKTEINHETPTITSFYSVVKEIFSGPLKAGREASQPKG
jgi:hypothetical protein